MNTSRAHSRHYVVALFTFALPAVVFLAVRSVMPAARPSEVDAAADLLPSMDPMPVRAPVTDAERELLATFEQSETHARERVALGLGAVNVQNAPTGPTPRASHDLPTGVALTSVMKTAGGTVAVIQGKLYRVGDRITPEWTLSAIDDKARTATLLHSGGESRTLAIVTPEGR